MNRQFIIRYRPQIAASLIGIGSMLIVQAVLALATNSSFNKDVIIYAWYFVGGLALGTLIEKRRK